MNTKQEKVRKCQELLGYRFNDESLLVTALTHSSCAQTRMDSNERMEFLGDSVLGLVVCHMLYRRLPDASEGELTKLKGQLVSRKTCYRIAIEMELDQYIFISESFLTPPDSLISNLVESIIGAIYLDGGFRAAARFVSQIFSDEIKLLIREKKIYNFKEALQVYVQRRGLVDSMSYRLMDEKGPSHRKCFKIAVKIGTRFFTGAWGNSKKDAEQKAAENALCSLKGLDIPYPDNYS